MQELDERFVDNSKRGLNNEIEKPTSSILTNVECYGSVINNYGQSVENTQTLPTCIKELNGIIFIGTDGTGAFHLKAGPSDKIYLDGIALDAGDKVSLAIPTVGDFFSFVSFKHNSAEYDWIIRTKQGTLTDGGV